MAAGRQDDIPAVILDVDTGHDFACAAAHRVVGVAKIVVLSTAASDTRHYVRQRAILFDQRCFICKPLL